MSSVKTDVNPSDIGAKALGRERFHRLRSMLGMGTELIETSSPGSSERSEELRRLAITLESNTSVCQVAVASALRSFSGGDGVVTGKMLNATILFCMKCSCKFFTRESMTVCSAAMRDLHLEVAP